MNNDDAISHEDSNFSFARLSSVIRIVMLITFLFAGLKIIRYGFLPAGDALRDAAQAINGRPFRDILVLIPQYKMNHNPGWDWLLRQLHVRLGMTEDQLLSFSVVALFLWMISLPLAWLRCPDAWLATLVLYFVSQPGLMSRFVLGRPLLLTEGVLTALLLAWSRDETQSRTKIILTTAGIALAVWAHGTWFLWALVPIAFFLARRWRAAFVLAGCCVAGSLLGALMTGSPVQLLRQSLVIALTVSSEHVLPMFTVNELQASAGEFSTLLVLFLVFLWRRGKIESLLQSPLFWMMAVCWLLGLTAVRFWVDWGLPAALVWTALQFQEMILAAWPARPERRLLVNGLMIVALFLVTTGDVEGRYTNMLRQPFTDFHDPRLKGWAPGKGGIFYGADMSFFYNTFYQNPEGDWRYIVGFEPAWMPPDDLKIMRAIQWSDFAFLSYEPWAKKMRPEDRLEISSSVQPYVPPLEWINAGRGIWIGRLPENPKHK